MTALKSMSAWNEGDWIAVISVVFGAVILRLARHKLLTLRYTLGWLAIAALGLLAS